MHSYFALQPIYHICEAQKICVVGGFANMTTQISQIYFYCDVISMNFCNFPGYGEHEFTK